MDAMGNGDEMLVAPSTDFFGEAITPPPAPTQAQVAAPPSVMTRNQPSPTMLSPFSESPAPLPPPAPAPKAAPAPPPTQKDAMDAAIAHDIEVETEWSGLFLKRAREARRISLEELSGITKISKTYLTAIEDENFAKLPAQVFVRGFLTQVARTLKLPADKMVPAYLARFSHAALTKNK